MVWSGGNAQGPFGNAGGAVGSSDLSPEAVEWVTSGDVPSQHTSERWCGRGFLIMVVAPNSQKKAAGLGVCWVTHKINLQEYTCAEEKLWSR